MLLICFPGKGITRPYPPVCPRVVRENIHRIVRLILAWLACRWPAVAVFHVVRLILPLTLTVIASDTTWLSRVKLSRGLTPCLQLWLSSVC